MMRHAFVLVTVVFFASIAPAQPPDVRLSPAPIGIDVTKNLGANNLVAGKGVTTNSARFGAALADRSQNGPFLIPAGGYVLTSTITAPNRSGYRIVGASTGRNAAESQYADGWGGNATRWLWKGAVGGTMLSVPGWGFQLDGVRFEGNPDNGVEGVTRPGIGIHYVAPPKNLAPTSSSMRLGWLTFDGMDCGIFCGHDKAAAASPDSRGNYSGHRYTHADTVFADRLDFRAIQQACYWVANSQSVQHHIQHVECVGAPSGAVPVFKMQRGGALKVGFLEALNSCTFLEVSRITSNSGTCVIDSWAMDAQADDCCLVRFTTDAVKDAIDEANIVIGPGTIPNGSRRHLIDTGATGKHATVTLTGVRGLTAKSFKINGKSAGGPAPVKYVCTVNLIACELEDTDDPAALVDASLSKTLWRINWKDCTARVKVVRGVTYGNYPIADGYREADDVGR